MNTVTVLRHVPHETLGTVEFALLDAGLTPQYVDLFAHTPAALSFDAMAGLIVLGGPMNVDEVEKYPFLAAGASWIQTAVELGVPVLGICLGAQLLAKALGAKVTANRVKEIGWYSVDLTPAAQDDALLTGVGQPVANSPGRISVFQWHGDTFALPDGAVHLGRSEACENQAFRFGRAAYGLQFHLEVTAEMIDTWLAEPGNACEVAGLPYIDPPTIRRQTPAELPAMHALGKVVFGRFATLCRDRAGAAG